MSQRHLLSDIEQLQQLVARLGWKVRYYQLAPGRIEVEAFETWIQDLLFFRERYECPMLAHGVSSPEAFDIMLCSSGSLRLFGEEMSAVRVGLFPPSSEVDAVGLTGLETLHVQVDRERLERHAASLGIELLRESGLLTVAPGIDRVNRLRRLIQQETGSSDSSSETSESETIESTMDLLVAIFNASTTPNLHARHSLGRPSELAITVRKEIERQPAEELELDRVEQGLAVGRRHLNRCFKEHYGMSIQSYVRIRHLHEARRAFFYASPTPSVTDVAYESGFRHLGRFSSAYRDLFGETPSQSLRRASTRQEGFEAQAPLMQT